jgi:hypothetical protein
MDFLSVFQISVRQTHARGGHWATDSGPHPASRPPLCPGLFRPRPTRKGQAPSDSREEAAGGAAGPGQEGVRGTARAGRFAGTDRLTAICDKWKNGKSISSIDTGRASIERGAMTDSDLARPPGGDHPGTQQASPGVLTRSAARRGRSTASRVCTRVPMTRSDARHGTRMRLPGRLGDRGRAGRRRTGPDRLEDRGRRTRCGSGPTPSIRRLAESSPIG